MAARTQTRVLVARQPAGVPEEGDFALVAAPVPTPGIGEFVARVQYLSLDPYLRSVMAGRHVGHAPLAPGDLMPGRAVAVVESSRHRDFAPGAPVLLESGWQEYCLSDGTGVQPLTNWAAPLSTALGVLGMPGLTAWAGIRRLLEPTPGETVLVSAASGAVGSAAGQFARFAGARVVGLAGSDEKCRHAVDTFGFSACVNYRAADWQTRLAEACTDGVHACFDNVGGDLLTASLDRLAIGGRVALCGLISQYNGGPPSAIPTATIIKKRARVLGLVVYDHQQDYPEFLRTASPWVASGRLRYLEDRADGLSAAPAAFCRLMSGRNIGKSLVVVSEDQPTV